MPQDSVKFTTSEVARKYAVTPSTVRRWVIRGLLVPAVITPGGHYRFDNEDVEALAAKQAEVSA